MIEFCWSSRRVTTVLKCTIILLFSPFPYSGCRRVERTASNLNFKKVKRPLFRKCRLKLSMALLKWRSIIIWWSSPRHLLLDKSLEERSSRFRKWNISVLPTRSHPRTKHTSKVWTASSAINFGISPTSMTSLAPSNNSSTMDTPSRTSDLNTCIMATGLKNLSS